MHQGGISLKRGRPPSGTTEGDGSPSMKGGLYTSRQEAPILNMTSNDYARNGADPCQAGRPSPTARTTTGTHTNTMNYKIIQGKVSAPLRLIEQTLRDVLCDNQYHYIIPLFLTVNTSYTEVNEVSPSSAGICHFHVISPGTESCPASYLPFSGKAGGGISKQGGQKTKNPIIGYDDGAKS